MVDKNKLIPKSATFSFAKSGAVTDHVLMSVAVQYDQESLGKMVFIPQEKLRTYFLPSQKVFVSEKYDGEGVFIYFSKEIGAFCFNAPSGRVRVGFKSLLETESFLKNKLDKALFRAELYLASQSKKRNSSSDVIKASFSTDSSLHDQFQLAVIDVIMVNGQNFKKKPLEERTKWLQDLFVQSANIGTHHIHSEIIDGSKVEEFCNTIIEKGGEGIVVRRLDRSETFKIKPRRTATASIIGYTVGDYENGKGIASLLTAFSFPDNQNLFQVGPRVGSGFTEQSRHDLLSLFEKLPAESALSLSDSEGRVVIFSQPLIAAQIAYEDLDFDTKDKQPYQTQTLQYSADTKTFALFGMTRFPKFTFATFVKLIQSPPQPYLTTQINPNLRLPEVKESIDHSPKIVRREVYGKGDMIRKLIVIKTFSTSQDNLWLIYWIDFSEKRKEKFKSDLKVAFSEPRVQQLCTDLLSENIVKGWSRIDK